jgi:glyoxalase family protein
MAGIHHVTAIAGQPTRNYDFYTRTLGLRFVKKTVNFDNPGTYHFYYGDETGQPGTILTFFPWEHAAPGRGGVGQTQQTAFRVPAGSLGYWAHRFIEKGVVHQPPERRFGEWILSFVDPDGTSLALVGVASADQERAWSNGDVPGEHAIRGFHGITLLIEDSGKTGAILSDVFGFERVGQEGSIIRFRAPQVREGAVVDIYEAKGFLPGRLGLGSVHHIAFRATDDAEQAEMVRKLTRNHAMHPTEQMDRNYFRSVYFREPGGILFEIATDIPGFAVDEPVATLGQTLKLPEFLESHRKEIERVLPPLERVERAA